MATFRTEDIEAKYQQAIAEGHLTKNCPLCKEDTTVKDFKHWRIIRNDFPYNLIASVHDLIIPKRHVTESGLTPEERGELSEIRNTYIDQTYEYVMESTISGKSIPGHFHLHLITSKD